MIADALGNPLAFTLTGSEHADITQAPALIESVAHPQAVIADKAYDADALVASIEQAGAAAVIPSRSNRRTLRMLDQHRDRARHLIENLFARLKPFRRLATRYDKLDEHFAAVVILASICAWMA